MKKLLVFVAGKYTGDEERCIAEAEEVSIKLLRNGFYVFTPHKNMGGYEKYEDDVLNYALWTSMCRDILLRCDLVYVLKNWIDSPGTKKEIEHAVENGVVVVFEDNTPTAIDQCTNSEVIRCLPSIRTLEKL